MTRRTRLRAQVAEEAFASVVFDALLSVSAVALGVVMLVIGIRGLAGRAAFAYPLTSVIGAGLLVAGVASGIPQLLQLPARRLHRREQAHIDAEVDAFAATLAGAEPFDITGRL